VGARGDLPAESSIQVGKRSMWLVGRAMRLRAMPGPTTTRGTRMFSSYSSKPWFHWPCSKNDSPWSPVTMMTVRFAAGRVAK